MISTIEYFVMITVFVVGACVGSFLNVVICRLPAEGESIVFPASHCPGCGKDIRWYDNLPVISFILLGGKCRQCKGTISFQYPAVELSMALLSLGLYYKFGLTWSFGIYFFFLAALVAIIFIDAHHQIIPDVISIPGVVLGFGASFLNPYVTWQASGIGLLAGGGSLYAVAYGYYLVTKREGMGGGDIKLLAMIGAFLGWQSLPFVVFGSSVIGSLFGVAAMMKQKKGGRTVIPYGPFLSLAAIVYLFFQEQVHLFYLVLSRPH